MLDQLDAALSATAGGATVLLAGWLLLSLLTAVALRVTAGSDGGRSRQALDRALDRVLRLLAPGLAGRAVRAAVGLGATGSAVFAGVAFAPSSAVAQPQVPTLVPALIRTVPIAAPAPAEHAPALPSAVPESRTPATDLWPLSPQRPLSPQGSRSPQVRPSPPASRGRGENPAQPSVVVLRGDTLWAIAARHLPAGASNASIDAAWRRWFDLNRAVIGADPDLLLPGQVLVTPGRAVGVPG